jgi:hypothetical protein
VSSGRNCKFSFETLFLLQVTIQGCLLPKSILGAQSHFVSPDSVDGSSQDVTLCRVEQVAITHYKREGYDQGR